jgi:hypothetical protein
MRGGQPPRGLAGAAHQHGRPSKPGQQSTAAGSKPARPSITSPSVQSFLRLMDADTFARVHFERLRPRTARLGPCHHDEAERTDGAELFFVHAKSPFRISCRVAGVGAQSDVIRSDRIGMPSTHLSTRVACCDPMGGSRELRRSRGRQKPPQR